MSQLSNSYNPQESPEQEPLIYDEQVPEDTKFNNHIELEFGYVPIEEIPIVLREPRTQYFSRFYSWIGLIIVALLIVAFYIIKSSKNHKKQRAITSDLLIKERESKIRQCKIAKNERDVPACKYIDLHIPTSSFGSNNEVTLDDLIEMQVTTTKGNIIDLRANWSLFGDMYRVRFILPNYTKLTSLLIHVDPTVVFANNWIATFKTAHILVRDKADTIIWKDTIMFDFKTGDSSAGYISEGYIPLQLDMDKYI
jgi:hypothetical protein